MATGKLIQIMYILLKKNKCKREMGVMAEELDGSGGCYCPVHF